MRAEFIVCFDQVRLGYGRETILENVSFEIPAGLFLPFIGPNGAGKTTLLRAVLGLIRPQKGIIKTFPAHIRTGYVPQHKALDPLFPLTVSEIISMGFYPDLGAWKNPNAEQKREMHEILRELQLSAYEHKNYRDLSGGTKQKVLIARALVSGADILVMDEPVSELDEAAEHEVFSHLGRLVSEQKKTVLIAHHGVNEKIRKMAELFCVVARGTARMIPAAEFRIGEGF